MNNVMPIRTPAETTLLESFAGARGRLPGNSAILARREKAFAGFVASGLPHRRIEAWKYTDLRGIMRESAPLSAPPSQADTARALAVPAAITSPDAIVFSLVNGHFVGTSGTLPIGVSVISLAQALRDGHADLSVMDKVEVAGDNTAIMLNTAFMSDGLVIRVAAGVHVQVPLVVRLITDDEVALTTAVRVLVVLEADAALTLVESSETRGAAHQPNTVVEAVIGDDAHLTHLRGADHDRDAIILCSLVADLGARAHLTSASLIVSGAMQRAQCFVRFGGADARMTVNGGTMVNGKQHADSTLVIDHAEPGGESRELFRTVVDHGATGVFQGKIIVRQKAQKTDGRMASNAVLLGENATMNNKPELEIFADDVQCAHGATCGALDDDLLFYLMARGLPRAEAEALIIESFVGEILEPVAHEGLRAVLISQIETWLASRGAAT